MDSSKRILKSRSHIEVLGTMLLKFYDSGFLSAPTSLWATEPYRVVKLKKKKICRFFCINHYIYIWVGDIRPKLVGSSLFRASTALKTGQNGPFWLILATLACLTPSRPFFWLDLSGYHLWTFTLGCGKVISGPISLAPALLQPPQPSKQAQPAHFGQFWLLWLLWHPVDHFFDWI